MKTPPAPGRRPRKTKPEAKAPARAGNQPATRSKAPPKAATDGENPSRLIDQRIRDLGGWRGETLARMRGLILQADPGITEEWKWQVPVWSHHGIVCTGEAYKTTVKLTFAHGAAIPDPAHLFNASLDGDTRRAIDLHQGGRIDADAFTALVQAAVARNASAKETRDA